MNKYFSLLGLREDAGKDDVKAAYERRVRKYKSSDYDDDPEYVRKKLAELKEAYEQAYRMAGSGSSSLYRRDDFARSSASSSASTASGSQQAHRRLHDQEEKEARRRRAKRVQENEFRKDQIEAEEEGSLFRKPDLSSLRQKAGSLRDEIKSQADELKNTISDAMRDDADQPSKDDEARSSAGQIRSTAVPQLKKAARRPDHDTGGTVMDTPSGSRSFHGADKESAARHGKFIAFAIILIITVISGLGQCSYDDDYYDYDDFADYDSYETGDSYSYAFLTDLDQIIFDTAMDSCSLLFDTGYSSDWRDSGYSDQELQTEADQFAENYLDMDQFSDVIDYLYDTYDEFYITTDDDLEDQIAEALKFYGFMRPDEAAGYISPFNDHTIANAHDYLVYLHDYFDENGLTEY